jgi:hypothetical protein
MLLVAMMLWGLPANAGWDCGTKKDKGPQEAGEIEVRVSPGDCGHVHVTATARDCWGDPVPGFSGKASWTDLAGAISPDRPSDFVNGVSESDASVGTETHGEQIQITAGGLSGTSERFDTGGNGTAVRLEIATVGPRVACTSFEIVATARDACGNVARGFDGHAEFSDKSGTLRQQADTPVTASASAAVAAHPTAEFRAGVAKASVLVPAEFASDTIGVRSGSLEGSSEPFDVAGFGKFDHVKILPLPRVVHRCHPFELRALAADACGNRVHDYAGAATWSDLTGRLKPEKPPEFSDGELEARDTRVCKRILVDRITLRTGGVAGTSDPFVVKSCL